MGEAGFVNRSLLSTAGKRLQQNGLKERQKTVVIFWYKGSGQHLKQICTSEKPVANPVLNI
jgi:hypothetical protein